MIETAPIVRGIEIGATPERVFRLAESPGVTTRIELTVVPVAEGRCRVEVVHSGWEEAPELRPMHDAGWAHFLGALAEGRPFDSGVGLRTSGAAWTGGGP